MITKNKNELVLMADVDETICESCQIISDEMAEMVDKLISQGTTLVFISGTDIPNLKEMLQKIKGKYYILGTQGTTAILKEKDKETVLYDKQLTIKEKEEITLAFDNLISNYNIIPVTSREDQLQDRGSQITLSAIGRHAPRRLKSVYDKDRVIRTKWKEFMETLLDMEQYDICIGGTTSIDVTKKGWDKGKGIELFCNTNNIDTSNVIYFGDKLMPGGNDYPATRVINNCVMVTGPEDTLLRLKQVFIQNIY